MEHITQETVRRWYAWVLVVFIGCARSFFRTGITVLRLPQVG